MTRDIDILLDLYNLRLDLNFSEEKDRFELKQRDFKKLREFFEKYTPDIFHRIDPKTLKRLDHQEEPFQIELWRMLDYFKHRTGGEWWESEDFQEFLFDYWRVEKMIDHFYDKRKVLYTELKWVDDLKRCVIQSMMPVDSSGTPLVTIDSKGNLIEPEWVDFEKYHVVEISTGTPLGWHGIGIQAIAAAIYNGLRSLFFGETPIRRCAITDCRKLFVPQSRGSEQRFCSASCRVTAHKQRRETQEQGVINTLFPNNP
jgi:hypothetical protein